MPVATPPFPIPKKIAPKPETIIRMIVATFTSANQNSSSPYIFTAMKLMLPMSTSAAKAHIQFGMSGYQTCMYTPTAEISAMQVTIHMNQYVHPVRYPASGTDVVASVSTE